MNLDKESGRSELKELSSQKEDRHTDLLVLMDSNRRHIKWRQFWTMKRTEKYFGGKLIEDEQNYRERNPTSINHILIYVGVNDLDTRTPEQVSEHLKIIVSGMQKKFVGVKIVISEIMPRHDGKDKDVIKCNELISTLYKNSKDVTIAPHLNLRDDEWSMYNDVKHVSEAAVPRLISNIKRALRKSHGVTADGSIPQTIRKMPLEKKLRSIAGYKGKEKPTTPTIPEIPYPNLNLMQLAQLLRLAGPT